MSNLKDTEVDDLIRRASDKYPLRTDSADWIKMAAALDMDPVPAGTGDGDDKRRKRRFFWLLLLLPLGGAGYYTLTHTGNVAGQAGHAAVAVVAGQTGHPAAAVTTGQTGHPSVAVVAGQTGHPAAAITTGQTSRQDVGRTAKNVPGAGLQDVGRTAKNIPGSKGVDGKAVRMDRQVKDGAPASGNSVAADRQFNNGSAGAVNPNRAPDPGRDLATAPQPYIATAPLSLEWAGDMQRAHIPHDYRLSVNVTAPPPAKNTDPAKPKKQKTAYLYAGILGAPDISTVKMQSVKGIGSTFGVLVGYAFNPRWSIETGAYLDRKKYYTEGEYFNKSNLNLYGGTMLNADGTCSMWEIPLNVRYTFNPNGKTKFFATAGVSTYLMTKENYTYAYQSALGWQGQKTYNNKNPSRYPFSIFNLSFGFEQRLGRVGSLRLEPYLRLPLEGIGTGKLPIMSAGVNIGITRRLW